MSDQAKREASLTLFFTAFLFLWAAVLGLGSDAGEGWLSAGQRELVYYVQQIFSISGFLAYALLFRLVSGRRFRRCCALGSAAILVAGTAVLLFADTASPFYVAVTLVVTLCLGMLGGAVYHRMSRETARGLPTAFCMGVGSALAVGLQYLLQLRWGRTFLLPVFLLAAFLLLAYGLFSQPSDEQTETEAPASGTVPGSRLLIVCLITALFLLFCGFYNAYIVHRQTLPDNASAGYYSWPRLMMIPCYLLFALIGDRKQGRLVPVAALCIALAATLNAVLTGSDSAWWLNMCLFYCALAATISYYSLVFWRLAPATKRPALWASMGRMLDSVMVLLTGAVGLNRLPPAVVLGADIAGVALVILLMALGGDFNLSAAEALPAPEAPPTLSPEEALSKMRERYDLTPREAQVLRELVLTEDKQAVISQRLKIQVRTLQDNVTRLYRKTGTETRAGLTDLYHETRRP